jgi:heptaprenyl diphosphate synthase
MISHTKVRIELVALFSACALFLSTIEYMIPKPVPFMRLGLANLPIIIALGIFSNREYFLLLLLKVLGQGLISGTIFSYVILFSLAGSLSSALFMLIIFTLFKDKVSRVGISLGGALASAISQLFISWMILFKEATFVIAPLFLFSALISSIILGIFANEFIQKSIWYANLKDKTV